jgi:hypothetical protein
MKHAKHLPVLELWQEEEYPQRQLRCMDNLPGDTSLFDSGEGNSFREGLGDGFDGFVLALFHCLTSFVNLPEEGEVFEFSRCTFRSNSVP